MLEAYKILTVTYRHTKLKELPHFAIPHSEEALIQQRLDQLKEQFGIEELMYLSTCNRILFLLKSEVPLSSQFISQFFNAVNPKMPERQKKQLANTVAFYEGTAAIEHLFQVAASVDSLVVGEREILRQLRDAYEQSKEWKLTGDHIRLAMRHTVEAAKSVYAKTKIGERPVSVVSLAIQRLLEQKLDKQSRILIIGAGQTNTLVAKFLIKHGFQNTTVFNRSFDRAQKLAGLLKGEAHELSALPEYTNGFDCLIVCTGANKPIVTLPLYKKLLNGDTAHKVIIDLAIPNNISSDITEQFPVTYIEIEGLRNLAKENLSFREREVGKAKELLRKQLRTFVQIHQHRQIEKAMHEVPTQIKAVKAHALNNVFKKELENLDNGSRELLERMLSYMEKQCISIPMKAAKKGGL